MQQEDLFSRYPDRPGAVKGSDTSEAAADSLSDGDLSRIRKLILSWVRACPRGSTCDEIEAALGLRHQTASARIRELVLTGYLVDSGQRRLTRARRSARVYMATET